MTGEKSWRDVKIITEDSSVEGNKRQSEEEKEVFSFTFNAVGTAGKTRSKETRCNPNSSLKTLTRSDGRNNDLGSFITFGVLL